MAVLIKKAATISGLYLTFIMGISGCRKDDIQTNCAAILQALKDDNKEMLAKEINAVIGSLNLNHSSLYNSQQEDMDRFIEKLNACGSIHTRILCLWCVETLPPQTEIYVEYMKEGVTNTKVIDLIREKDFGFRFANLH